MYSALTAYPLDRQTQLRLEQFIGDTINYLTLTELRKLSLAKLFSTLRNLPGKYFLLPLEDDNSASLIPLLACVASIAKNKTIEIIYPDLSRKTISKFHILKSVFNLMVTTLSGHLLLGKSILQLKKLHKASLLLIDHVASARMVAYINANLWYNIKAGGSVGHIAGVANALQQSEWPVHYAAISDNSGFHPAIQKHLLKPSDKFSLPWELSYYRFNEVVVREILQIFANKPLGFIYQRMSIANYSGVLLSRKFKVPLVLEYNGSEVWAATHWGKGLRYSKAAMLAEEVNLKHAHLVVTVSQVLADELQQRGVAKEKIICYPNCIDPTIFNAERFSRQDTQQLRQRYRIADDAVLLTFVGTFGQWHGVEIIAQLIYELITTQEDWLQRNRIHFLLVGDGIKMEEVKTILRRCQFAEYVTLTGLIPQAEAAYYLAASDILLSPHIPNSDGSRFFGSPTKLFEYMAMGKAIVASDLEQIGEVLKNSLRATSLPQTVPAAINQEIAVLCEPGNINELKQAIQFLVENPLWRLRLGDNARRECLNKYTWAHHVAAFLQKIPHGK